MTEMTLGPEDLDRLADLLWGPTRYEITTAREGMRACASAWKAELAELDEANALLLGAALKYTEAQEIIASLRKRLETAEKALIRIVGMCDVGGSCSCGRTNGLPAVVACAKAALAAEEEKP